MQREVSARESHGGEELIRTALLLRSPGTGTTHLATGRAIRACQAGHRTLFATASDWVTRLADAHQVGRLAEELRRLGRHPLLPLACQTSFGGPSARGAMLPRR